jgi:sec-independent protein translocase protein TatA
MPSIGPMELIVVLVIALVVLGPKRLPSAGRALGEGLRGFKESVSGRPETPETLPTEASTPER